jgi:hypothetical protein
MKIELNSFQAELLRDLAIEEQKAIQSGSTIYGDANLQADVVDELQEIIEKLGELI